MYKRGQDIKSKNSSTSFVSPKKGQMEMSFGTIFSVILIILFIVFAVYGIGKFLSTVNYGKVEKFKNEFQTDINDMWKSTRGSQQVEYILPGKVHAVCFRKDGTNAYMYFEPFKLNYEGEMLNHINIESTLRNLRNPSCIQTSNGKLSLVIEKDYDENLVVIKKTSS